MNVHITIDPAIRHGKPVIRGTRVPVARILGELSAGTSFQQIQTDYGLSVDDIRAAIDFARELVEEQSFHPASVE
jgi:uncharacterized protein (DUF433 family)